MDTYQNRKRVHEATALRERLVTDGLGRKEHTVLQVLAAAMAQPPNPESPKKRNWLTIVDTCFLTQETIAKRSFYTEKSVRIAVKRLVACGYLSLSHFVLYGRPRIRYHRVPEIWDTALVRPKSSEGGVDHVTVPSEEDKAFLDALGGPAVIKTEVFLPKIMGIQETESIVTYLQTIFGEHPTFQHKDHARIMGKCAAECIEMAGSAEICLEVFESAISGPRQASMRSMIEESKMLGGYLKGCFPKWLSSYLENGSAASKKVPKPKPSSLRSLAPEEDLDDEDQDPVQSTSYGSDYDDDEPMLDEDGELYKHDPDADDPPSNWADPDDEEREGRWEDE